LCAVFNWFWFLVACDSNNEDWKIFDGFTWTLIESLIRKLNLANPEFVQAIRDVYKLKNLRHLICRQLELLSKCAFQKEDKGEGGRGFWV
jgi:hypothetical protein